MIVRAIATDLDGTLLRSDGTVSTRSVEALAAAEAAGILLVIATARPPRSVRRLIEQLGELGVAVCANGALVYDTARHAIVESYDIPVERAREIVARLRRTFPEFALGVEQGLVGRRDREYVLPEGVDDVELGRVEDFLDLPTAKIFARFQAEPPPELAGQVRQLLDGLADVTFSAGSGASWLELMHPGVNKARTVESVIAGHGIGAADVVAFGDMPNDLELLRWAGRGVAVANAHPDVLAAADEITASNDDDGVAAIVERILR
jgi:Cof subfamily protein (haloacid dehalogenase superfamily)